MVLPDSGFKRTSFQFLLKIHIQYTNFFLSLNSLSNFASPSAAPPPGMELHALTVQGSQIESDLHGAVSVPLSASL